MERSCGNCAHWKPTRLEVWAAPVAVGTCTFGPAPECVEGHRTRSANHGRGCPVFCADGGPRDPRLDYEPRPLPSGGPL